MGAYALPELNAMQQIAIVIQELSTQERKRVASWLMEYASQEEIAPMAASTLASVEQTNEFIDASEAQNAAIESADMANTFDSPEELVQPVEAQDLSTFDAFFEAAGPKKGAQKAAVAAYWLESKQNLSTWKAFDVNKLLKSIGVKVSSISIVLTNAVKVANPLFVESDRMGDGERSRKTFHLSEAGIAYVESLIA